jgi:hypothetical protein
MLVVVALAHLTEGQQELVAQAEEEMLEHGLDKKTEARVLLI